MLAATPESLLAATLQLLPPGQRSHYAKSSAGDLVVQTQLDDGSGPGLIRIAVTPFLHRLSPRASSDSWRLPSGNAVTVSRVPGNCVQSLHVDVQRPNGVVVSVDVATCRPERRSALTQEQAIALADDPLIGAQLPADLVLRSATRFPNLARFP